jgi:uncharacterized membrane protein YhaH (DUF805 family)
MLGFLFGFNARLGRMHFFLATIALAVVMTAICFAIVMQYAHSNPSGALPSKGLMAWPLIAAAAFFAWMTFTLQSMRIRDIGWDPVCVIPAWIAILIVDQLVAGKIPAWSLGHNHSGTIIGAATNLFLMLARHRFSATRPEGRIGRRQGLTTRRLTRPGPRAPAAPNSVAGHLNSAWLSHLLERKLDLAALLQPLRHGQLLRAHEFRIEQL